MYFDIPPAFPAWIQPEDGEWWIATDSEAITFSVKEVAKIFFKKSGSWLRMREKPTEDIPGRERHPAGWFTEEDITVPIQVHREQGKAETYEYRRYTLRDLERMAWSMYRHEVIEHVWWYGSQHQTGKRAATRLRRYNELMAESVMQLEVRIELVKWMGRLYGLIPMPSQADPESPS
jgi:hypothetical protein